MSLMKSCSSVEWVTGCGWVIVVIRGYMLVGLGSGDGGNFCGISWFVFILLYFSTVLV